MADDPIRDALERAARELELVASSLTQAGWAAAGSRARNQAHAARATLAAQPPTPAPAHDLTVIAPLLWVLWHHQAPRSRVGQPIRRFLGIAPFERLKPEQIAAAAQYEQLQPVEVAESVPAAVWLKRGEVEP